MALAGPDWVHSVGCQSFFEWQGEAPSRMAARSRCSLLLVRLSELEMEISAMTK